MIAWAGIIIAIFFSKIFSYEGKPLYNVLLHTAWSYIQQLRDLLIRFLMNIALFHHKTGAHGEPLDQCVDPVQTFIAIVYIDLLFFVKQQSHTHDIIILDADVAKNVETAVAKNHKQI